MNTDRLLREVERRLAGLPEKARAEALDAIREEIGRERRRNDPGDTVEMERERRQMAEKQLARVVVFDSCSVALLGADGRFRIVAGRGFADPAKIVGHTFRNQLREATAESPWPIAIPDVNEDARFERLPGGERVRSWAGIPLLVEGQLIGLLGLDRHRVEPFEDEELHRAKTVAFSGRNNSSPVTSCMWFDTIRRSTG